MDFRSMNKFNVIMNIISGNFYPLSGEKTSLGFVRKTYHIFTWSATAAYLVTTSIGTLFFAPAVDAFRKGCVNSIVFLEMIILAAYLDIRSERLRMLIGKLSDILVKSDEFRECVRESITPHMNRLKVFTLANLTTGILWTGFLPMTKLLHQEQFTYTDFTVPSYYPGEPFSGNVFFCGIIVEMIGIFYVVFKKGGVDTYVMYLISLLTAEYRYLNLQIIDTLKQENAEKSDESVIASLQKCVKHHCLVMDIGKMITELLYVNVASTYIVCILKITVIGFALVTITEIQEKLLFLGYLMVTMIQVYMLCTCGQEVLDASTTIADGAFHEAWYERGKSVKNVYRIMAMGGRLECRMNAFGVVDLTVTTYAAILNQAYSLCLLLLNVY